MRICFLSSVLSSHDCRFLVKMVKSGLDTYLVTYIDGEIPRNIKEIPGLKIIHNKPKCFHSIQKFLFATKVNSFRRILKDIKPDIVHSGFTWKDGFLAALSGFRPHLLMPWGSDILVHPDKSFFCRKIVEYAVSNSDMIACDCLATRNKIVDMTGFNADDIIVFPRGVDLGRFRYFDDTGDIRKKLGWENKKIIISTRTFHPIYQVEKVIGIMTDIIKEEPEARLLLVSSGPEEDKFRSLVKDSGLDEYVHFAGRITDEDMPRYLSMSDIYTSFSLSDGSSLCLMEAFACNLPVVISNVPSSSEWVKNGINGFIVSKHDTEELCKKIIKLLKNKDLRTKMRETNLQIAGEKADWNKNFNKLTDAYLKLHNNYNNTN